MCLAATRDKERWGEDGRRDPEERPEPAAAVTKSSTPQEVQSGNPFPS